MGAFRQSRSGSIATIETRRFTCFFEAAIVGMLASSYLAMAASGALDLPSLVLAGVAIAARSLLAAGVDWLRPSESVVTAATLACLGFFPLDYFFLTREFLGTSVHLVIFLASVLILRATTARDFFLVKVCAFLQMLAATVLSAGMHYLLFLSLFTLSAIAAQVSGEMRSNLETPQAIARSGLRGVSARLAALALFAFLSILVVGIGFFFVLPRTAQAAFQHLLPGASRISGFANEIRLGQIGRLLKNSTPVFHARVRSPDRPLQLKWRGSALTQFDGRRWYNPPESEVRMRLDNGQVRLPESENPLRRGLPFSYEVQIKNAAGDVLFLAGSPIILYLDAPAVYRSSVSGYRVDSGQSRGLRYQAVGVLEDVAAPLSRAWRPLGEAAKRRYLELPRLDWRIPIQARELTATAPDDYSRAHALEQHLRTSYGYTLDLLDTEPADPIAHFLFERRKGHCEYFAASMAVMLRTLGIPSRVATGFQSGTYNPVSGWYLVRASDAHSWVEAYIPRFGWVTFDPTPPDSARQAPGLLSRLGMYLDAAEVFWQEWVVSYDLERQILLAHRMTSSSRTFSLDWVYKWDEVKRAWRKLAGEWTRVHTSVFVLAATMCALGLILGPGVWRWWKHRERVQKVRLGRARSTDATLLYEQMLRLLNRKGIRKPAWMTPNEFAKVVPAAESELVHGITASYNALRFGGEVEAAPRMVLLLERLQGRMQV